jgi:hypothetical protein
MSPYSVRPKLPLLHIETNPHDAAVLRNPATSCNANFRVYGATDLESAALHFPLPDQPLRQPAPRLILLDYTLGSLHPFPLPPPRVILTP